MLRVILLQVVATVVAAIAGGSLAGLNGTISATLGGLVCVVPNLLFALRLKRVAKRPGSSYPAHFLLGEFVKLALIIGLLAVVVRNFADLHWPSLLIGLVLATQALFLAFWIKN